MPNPFVNNPKLIFNMGSCLSAREVEESRILSRYAPQAQKQSTKDNPFYLHTVCLLHITRSKKFSMQGAIFSCFSFEGSSTRFFTASDDNVRRIMLAS